MNFVQITIYELKPRLSIISGNIESTKKADPIFEIPRVRVFFYNYKLYNFIKIKLSIVNCLYTG